MIPSDVAAAKPVQSVVREVRTVASRDSVVLGGRQEDPLLYRAQAGVRPMLAPPPISNLAPGGRVGAHGMVVFGSPATGLYMSHIPMFHAPHDMQAFFKVTLPGDASFEDGLYTFDPKPFSLNDLLLGSLDTMQGTLYRGSFEGDGKPLGDVTVKVAQVIEAAVLTNDAPALPQLEYQVLGTPQDAYLIHPIGKPPDFDQILRLDLSHSTLSAQDISNHVHVVLPGRANDVDQRLTGGTAQVTVKGSDRQVQIGVDRVLSTLVGPMFTDGPK